MGVSVYVKNLIILILAAFFVLVLSINTGCFKRADNQNPPSAADKVSTSNTATDQDGGVGNTGGGNSSSREVENTLNAFANDGENIRKELIQWLVEFRKFKSQGRISADIHKMIDHGLIEDIQKTKFVFSESCQDAQGKITSMSTKKVNTFELTPHQYPDICINVPKLSVEKTEYRDIVGNLLHEYARHYGFEDTEKFGLHPFALYISKLFDLPIFSRGRVDSWGESTAVLSQPELYSIKNASQVTHTIFTPFETVVSLLVKTHSGDCSKFKIVSYEGNLTNSSGLIFPATEQDHSGNNHSSISIQNGPVFFTTSQGMRNLILSFKDTSECRVDLEIKTFKKESFEKPISMGTIQNLGLVSKSNGQIVSETVWISVNDLDLRDPK